MTDLAPSSSLPAQLVDVPDPAPPARVRTIADAIAHIHHHTNRMSQIITRLEALLGAGLESAVMRTLAINDLNDGVYTVADRAPDWTAQSFGLINSSAIAPVFVGLGSSPSAGGRAIWVPAGGALVLPVRVRDVELGCDPAVLLANTAVVFTFRYRTVQPLLLTGAL